MGLFGDIGSIVGPAIGGGLGLLGNSQTNAANAAAAQQSYEAQKEFAQNGIRWKVEDAKRAGIHPLAALGSMTSGYTPSQTMFTSPDYSFVGEMGQNIGRAVDAKRTNEERVRQQAFQDQMAAEQLRGARLQNDLTQKQIDSITQDMVTQLARSAELASRTQQQVPAMPSLGKNGGLAGQAQFYATGETEKDVSKVPTVVRGDASTQAGTPPDARVYLSSAGRHLLPTQDSADAMDAAQFAGLQWFVRNSLVPWLANYFPIKDDRRKPDEYYDLLRGGYYKKVRLRDFFR